MRMALLVLNMEREKSRKIAWARHCQPQSGSPHIHQVHTAGAGRTDYGTIQSSAKLLPQPILSLIQRRSCGCWETAGLVRITALFLQAVDFVVYFRNRVLSVVPLLFYLLVQQSSRILFLRSPDLHHFVRTDEHLGPNGEQNGLGRVRKCTHRHGQARNGKQK